MDAVAVIKNSEFCFLWRLLRARGVESVIRHLRERHSNHSLAISGSPPVVLLVWGRDDSVLHTSFKHESLTLLYLFYWDIHSNIPLIAHTIHRTLERFPRHRIVCLCNVPHQADLFRHAGVEAIFFNHNALVNEHIFRPADHGVGKRWDAIYVAQLSPFKRIELASGIPTLCVITYRYSGAYDRAYEKQIRADLPQAFWANEQLNRGAKLDASRVAQLIQESHCGLCLSETEGAMYASMEYLLTGTPVVTTPSRGGRSVFFDTTNAIVCEPNPESVLQAVREWQSRKAEIQVIRASVIQKIEEHRERLRRLLAGLGVDFVIRPTSPALTFQRHRNVVWQLKSKGGG